MNRLEPEILALRDSIQEIQACLIVSDEREKEVEKNQEQLEHRMTVLEDSSALSDEGLEHRVKMIEYDVKVLHEHLNAAITRINELHKCLNSLADKDLWCDEQLDVSDDDEEFDFSDYSDKVTEEIVRVQQMDDNHE